MTYYAAEQLTRDRWGQFSREAYGDNLIRLARDAGHPRQPRFGRLASRAAALVRRLRTRERRAAVESSVGSRSARPRIV